MKPQVLMTTEGTYPYFRGGVSVWCDQLIQELDEVSFHIFSIVPSPKYPRLFPLAANVASCRPFPLWGTSLPGAQTAHVAAIYEKSLRTTDEEIESRFLPPFATIVRCFLVRNSPSEDLAEAMLALHDYFSEFDYATTMQSAQAWSAFLAGCSRWLPDDRQLNLEEATACMRWLVRYLGILAVEYPQVDLVHASMTGLAGVPGVLAKLQHGTPYLLTEHGIYLRELYLALSRTTYTINCRRFLLSLNEAVVRMNYYYADLVTSLGDFNRAWQLRFGAQAGKIAFVPNGVDPSRFRPAPERRPARPTVVTLARIFALKGIDVLLRAAAIVRQRIPDVRFRILGEAADPDYYRQCLALVDQHQLHASVEWGETTDPATALVEAHVFCLPSVSEGMPYSMLEAMLSGCPVVASNVGNVSTVLGGNGVLVRPRDPQDLAKGLLSLLEGADGCQRREQFAAGALERARRHYTLKQCADGFRQIYGELCASEQTSQIA